MGLPRNVHPEVMRERYRQLVLASQWDRFQEPTCAERWRTYSLTRSYE